MLRLCILEEPFRPAFERSGFRWQRRPLSRTMTLVGSRQIFEENSPGYTINRQMVGTEQEPSLSPGNFEEYRPKDRAHCKIQSRLDAGHCLFEDTVVNHHPLKWGGALRRNKSLLVAKEPEPERVMVLDQLPDSGFQSVDIQSLV